MVEHWKNPVQVWSTWVGLSLYRIHLRGVGVVGVVFENYVSSFEDWELIRIIMSFVDEFSGVGK